MSEEPREYRILVESLVAMRNREPYVVISFENPKTNRAQMPIEEARAHAQLVIEAAEAAIQDAFLIEYFTEKFQLTISEAARVVGDYRVWRAKKGL